MRLREYCKWHVWAHMSTKHSHFLIHMANRYSHFWTNICTTHSHVCIICAQDMHIFCATCPQNIRIFESTCPQNIHMFVPTCPQDFGTVSLARFLSASSLMRINYLKSHFRRHTNHLPLTVHLRQVLNWEGHTW